MELVLIAGGFVIGFIFYGIDVTNSPWDEWDAENYEERPAVRRLRRQCRWGLRLGFLLTVSGLAVWILRR